MVLSRCFDVDNEDLLKPEGQLKQEVPLERSRDVSGRPILPNGTEIGPVGRIVPKILERRESALSKTPPDNALRKRSHHSIGPECRIINQ